jgi:hypothetical protein
MHDTKELCEKIKSIYPEIGECGGGVEVSFDEAKSAYVVGLTRGEHQLSTHLELEDANSCMEGKECVSLGIQVSQLVTNVEQV